ncbi:MAG: ribosomal protein S18-alanine N-acetyltransferase [Eubacterium sp.]|nr:ribosomal protein S18-alanine N-acetyltransferase [Eubacterium sp.]
MPDIIVREMDKKDTEAVFLIEEQCFNRPWSAKGFAESALREDTVFLVAEKEGEILGYAGMYISFDEAEIERVGVDPGKRRMGIAGRIIGEMNKIAAEKGILSIILEVRRSNEAAIGLYKKYGFKDIGIRKNFYDLPREDAVIMKRIVEC